MAAQIGKYAANKMLKKQMKDYQEKKVDSGQDPYFAMIPDPKKPGKLRKVKKQIPSYIGEHDANILASVRKSAYRLDMCLFNFLGIRFGWEAVIGIIPGFGDVIGVVFALMLLKKCMKVDGGLDSSIKLRMLVNIALDFAVGLVPFIGDLADAAFKCNTRNLRLLESVLDKKYGPGRDGRDIAGADNAKRRKNRKSGVFDVNDPPPATVFEDFSDEELDRRNVGRRDRPNDIEMAQPPPAYAGKRQETGNIRR